MGRRPLARERRSGATDLKRTNAEQSPDARRGSRVSERRSLSPFFVGPPRVVTPRTPDCHVVGMVALDFVMVDAKGGGQRGGKTSISRIDLKLNVKPKRNKRRQTDDTRRREPRRQGRKREKRQEPNQSDEPRMPRHYGVKAKDGAPPERERQNATNQKGNQRKPSGAPDERDQWVARNTRVPQTTTGQGPTETAEPRRRTTRAATGHADARRQDWTEVECKRRNRQPIAETERANQGGAAECDPEQGEKTSAQPQQKTTRRTRQQQATEQQATKLAVRSVRAAD